MRRERAPFDSPIAGVAIALQVHGARIVTLRVALTGTNSHPLRLDGTEALLGATVDADLLGALARLVARQTSPMRTTAMPSNYRRRVASVLTQRLMQALAELAVEEERPWA